MQRADGILKNDFRAEVLESHDQRREWGPKHRDEVAELVEAACGVGVAGVLALLNAPHLQLQLAPTSPVLSSLTITGNLKFLRARHFFLTPSFYLQNVKNDPEIVTKEIFIILVRLTRCRSAVFSERLPVLRS